METIDKITVYYSGRHVGTMASYRRYLTAFAYSSSIGEEHATTVAGEGRKPDITDILKVAKKAGLKESHARQIAERVQETVSAQLSSYL